MLLSPTCLFRMNPPLTISTSSREENEDFSDQLPSSSSPPTSDSEERPDRRSTSPSRPIISIQYATTCLSWIMKGLNDYDIPNLREILFRHCTTDLTIINQVYLTRVGRRRSQRSFRTTMRLNGIEPFIEYWSLVQTIIPDGFYHIQDIRNCDTFDDRNTSLYMSMLEFSGTNINPNTPFFEYNSIIDLRHSLDQSIITSARQQNYEFRYPLLKIHGSIGLYFNAFGLIYCIEFYYQQSTH